MKTATRLAAFLGLLALACAPVAAAQTMINGMAAKSAPATTDNVACQPSSAGLTPGTTRRCALPLPFATTAAMLAAYPSGVTPPAEVVTAARDSSDTQMRGGGVFYYDSAIVAPFQVTAAIATVPGATTMTVTAAAGTIKAGMWVTGNACVPPGDFILPTVSPFTGAGGSGTYALYLPATCSSGALTLTQDNGGPTRVDAAGHGFRLAKTQLVSVDLFGAYENATGAANNAPMQYALSDTYYRACGTGVWPPGGASPAVLNFYADGYPGYPTTAPLYVGAPGPSFQCSIPPVLHGLGYGGNAAMITGTLTQAAPVLDWSGVGAIVLDHMTINSGGGSETVTCFNGRIATLSGGQGAANSSTFRDSKCAGSSVATGSTLAAAMFQDDDLFSADDQSIFQAPGFNSYPSTAGPWGPQIALVLGETLPHSPLAGAYGIAQGGTTNTITLAAGASTVAGSFVGDPVRVYPTNTSGVCTGTFEPGYITAYNPSTLVATVSQNWASFTPTSSSCYTIYGAGSAFQPYAGLSGTNGATSMRLGGQYLGAVWHTGGSTVNFEGTPYLVSSGSPATNILEDLGNECIGAGVEFFGNLNTEGHSSVVPSSVFWPKNGSMGMIDVWGRLDGPSGASILRYTSADAAAAPACNYGNSPWGQISLRSRDLSSLTIFNTSSTIPSFTFRGLASSFGTPGAITHCDIQFEYSPPTIPASTCQEGSVPSGVSVIAPTCLFGTNTNGGYSVTAPACVPVASPVVPLTTTTTTGGSSQLRFSFAVPGALQNGSGQVLTGKFAMQSQLAGSTVPVLVKFVQGGTTQTLASFTLPASGEVEISFTINSGSVYTITATCSATCSTGPTSSSISGYSTTTAYNIEVFENGATGNALYMWNQSWTRVGGG